MLIKFKLNHRVRKGQSGFSLLELAAAIGISGLLVIASSKLVIDSVLVGTEAEQNFWLGARRTEIQGFVRSDQGWQDILSKNPNMNCFEVGASCSAFRQSVPMMLPLDGQVVDGGSAGLGLTAKGDICRSYSATAPNAACPVGIKMTWSAICDDANCLHAQPKVEVKFERGGREVSSYNLVVYKDAKLETLNEVCVSMGGTLSGTSCHLPQLSSSCDPSNGSFVLGFDFSGQAICGRPNPGNCAASDLAVGFRPNGGLQCAPACP